MWKSEPDLYLGNMVENMAVVYTMEGMYLLSQKRVNAIKQGTVLCPLENYIGISVYL